MSLLFFPFTLGPMENNTYLVADSESKSAALIDPSFGSPAVLQAVLKHSLRLEQVWLTHAHFDHIAGLAELFQALPAALPVYLHPADFPVWQARGGAGLFGIPFDPGPLPTHTLAHGQQIHLGEASLEVRHTPGHSPGHVVFYAAEEQVLFCGDLIFQGSIGRTDLPGGDFETLMNSIRSQVLTLPDETRLFAGHGPESTVGAERKSNPFLVSL